jgi:hypothetical protein
MMIEDCLLDGFSGDIIAGNTYIRNNQLLADIKHESFREPQSYMANKSIAMGRMAFRICTKMLNDIPANFKNKYKVNKGDQDDKEGLLCDYCDEDSVMDQAHCLQCEKWTDLRMGLDLTNIEDLVKFFSKMMLEKAKFYATFSKGSKGGPAQHDS